MKRAGRYFWSAVAAALVGAACLAIGLFERDVASAQRDLTTQHYASADAQFETAERYLEYANLVPGLGGAALNDVRTRRAAVRYWQREYGALAPAQGDPTSVVPIENVDLQVLVANAVYRSRQPQAKDKASTLSALNAGIAAYLTPLKNSPRRDDAAFNYEYLVRLREEIEKGRRKPGLTPPADESALGQAAIRVEAKTGEPFKTLVPLQPEELEKADAGKGLKIVPKG